jgi:hypothetical protein
MKTKRKYKNPKEKWTLAKTAHYLQKSALPFFHGKRCSAETQLSAKGFTSQTPTGLTAVM